MSPTKAIHVINPLFKLLLVINCIVSIVSFSAMMVLACIAAEPMTKAQDRLFHVCEFAFTTTVGAFVGLLGGRAASPDALGSGPELVSVEVKKSAPVTKRSNKEKASPTSSSGPASTTFTPTPTPPPSIS